MAAISGESCPCRARSAEGAPVDPRAMSRWTPATLTPWSPGSAKVKLTEKAALRDNDRLVCNWQGQIQVTNAGQAKVSVS